MKLLEKNQAHRRTAGLTLIEAVVVIAVLFILASLLLPMLAGRGTRIHSSRIKCVSNLKQIALSYQLWAGDHGDKFPMAVSTNDGGTLEFAHAGKVVSTFQVMSNELSDLRILVCPADKTRKAATSWTKNFGSENISYFIGLDAEKQIPNTLLAGDRNLTNGLRLQNQVMSISSNTPVGWNEQTHKQQGNIALADGSAQQLSSTYLRRQMDTALSELNQRYLRLPGTNNVMRLALP